MDTEPIIEEKLAALQWALLKDSQAWFKTQPEAADQAAAAQAQIEITMKRIKELLPPKNGKIDMYGMELFPEGHPQRSWYLDSDDGRKLLEGLLTEVGF